MSNGFILAEKYLEDSHTWNTGKAKEIEEKYIKEDKSISELKTFKKDLEKEIKNQFKGLMDVKAPDFAMTMESAIYWFASDYHSGQSDIWYSILSNSEYHPGRNESGVPKDSEEEMIYDYLEGKYGNKSSKKIQKDEDKHPYDLTKPNSKEADRKLLDFIKKYPNQWHSFSKDKATKDSIRKLENQGTIEVNWKNEQFYYETKEQKDETDSLFSRKDFFNFFDKHPEFKGNIVVKGPRENGKGNVEFVITTPKGGKRIVVTSGKTKEELEKIGQNLLK